MKPITPLLLILLLAVPGVSAAPWMWDQDGDSLDDRLEDVAAGGLLFARENLDPEGRLRFEVGMVDSLLQYGGYVRFDHLPTPADADRLALLGAEVISVFSAAPYIRVRALYPSLLLIAGEADVERVEAVSLMYPVNRTSLRATRVVAGRGAPSLTLESGTGLTGNGVVVAVLDTGINDAGFGPFPGQHGLAGKVVGGAAFVGPGPGGYTAWSASVNPAQATPALDAYHGTHVAATLAGGNRGELLAGVAPGALLLDVKVLDDQGLGYGLAEGLEWVYRNRSRSWGADSGIDVVNLSLSGTDPSDGDDCIGALAASLDAVGVLVVAAAGNDGKCGWIPAPGAADAALTVTAHDAATDAAVAFGNRGPRTDDGDGDDGDERKPDVSAPGVDVASAWGNPVGDGHGWSRATGTSMATAMVSGLAALLLEEDPGLSPAALRDLFRDTAARRSDPAPGCTPAPGPHGDARWDPVWGYGTVDGYAAWLEATSAATQFVAVEPAWNGSSVDVTWITQRETGITGFDLERAPDAGGAPGAFVPVTGSPVPALGVPDLSGDSRTAYLVTDTPPAGGIWWYRPVAVGGAGTAAPPVAVVAEDPVAVARTLISHTDPGDLALTLGTGNDPASPVWSTILGTVTDLDSLGFGPGAAPGEDLPGLHLSRPVYGFDAAATELPPSPSTPWFLTVVEEGEASRQGSVEAFLLEAGTSYPTGDPLPQSLTEGSLHRFWIPQAGVVTGVGEDAPSPAVLLVAPNPFRGATRITWRQPTSGPLSIAVHDVRGRQVRRLHDGFAPAGELTVAWDGHDEGGRSLAAGTYYLRIRSPRGIAVRGLLRLP